MYKNIAPFYTGAVLCGSAIFSVALHNFGLGVSFFFIHLSGCKE